MEGSVEFKILKDKWTAVSADDKRYVEDNQKYLSCVFVAVIVVKPFFPACGSWNTELFL